MHMVKNMRRFMKKYMTFIVFLTLIVVAIMMVFDRIKPHNKHAPFLNKDWWESATSEMVTERLALGDNVNAWDGKKNRPLGLAVRHNAPYDAIEQLVNAGADLNAVDKKKFTPLMWASSKHDDNRVALLLIERGADVNLVNRRQSTALSWAVTRADKGDIVTALIKAGADVNTRDSMWFTPLLLAIQYNVSSTVVDALLDAGADATVKDEFGNGVLEYLKDNTALKGTPTYERLIQAVKGA